MEADWEKITTKAAGKSVENRVTEARGHEFQEKMIKEDEFLKPYLVNN